ncbi:hypothetical protein [Streptomyces sp. NPDC002845]
MPSGVWLRTPTTTTRRSPSPTLGFAPPIVREQDADARPTIANPLSAIDRYDVVLLGSPIWNV